MVKEVGTLSGQFTTSGDDVTLSGKCWPSKCPESNRIEFNMHCNEGASTSTASIQVKGPDKTSDSVKLQVDEGEASAWHFGRAARQTCELGLFTWIHKTFDATAGFHKLRLLGRESGVIIKKIRIAGGCVLL